MPCHLYMLSTEWLAKEEMAEVDVPMSRLACEKAERYLEHDTTSWACFPGLLRIAYVRLNLGGAAQGDDPSEHGGGAAGVRRARPTRDPP